MTPRRTADIPKVPATFLFLSQQKTPMEACQRGSTNVNGRQIGEILRPCRKSVGRDRSMSYARVIVSGGRYSPDTRKAATMYPEDGIGSLHDWR